MKKIRNILLLSFSLFFILLAVVLIQNQYISEEARNTNKLISEEITPALSSISHIHAINREGMLLLIDRWNDKNNLAASNRIKQIMEVEVPYAMNNLHKVRKSSPEKIRLLRKIDSIFNAIGKRVQQMDELLLELQDEDEILNSKKLKTIVRKDIPLLSFELNNASSELEILYKNELKERQDVLNEHLKNASNFILITISIGSVIGLIIVFLVTKVIVNPILKLQRATEELQAGKTMPELEIKTPMELATLSSSFNRMSNNLAYSYNEIQRKNEELEQFVYITSHDLQEPLKTLVTLSDRLINKDNSQLDDHSKKYLSFIKTSTDRMSNMVAGLMEHSKLGKLSQIETVDINNVLNDVQVDLKASITDSYTQFQMEDFPEIKAYPVELRLLFQNIISNAIKFRSQTRIPNISISYSENDNYHIFFVKDNGIGLNPKYKNKVFAIFQRLHGQQEYKGTGIGLAHCKKIVDLHQGTIDIDGEIDQGTTISFCISKYL